MIHKPRPPARPLDPRLLSPQNPAASRTAAQAVDGVFPLTVLQPSSIENSSQFTYRRNGGITTSTSLPRRTPALQTACAPCVSDGPSLCIDEASQGICPAVAERSPGAEGECGGICAYGLRSNQYEPRANVAYTRPRDSRGGSTQDGPRE
jgi:hypothetical protein